MAEILIYYVLPNVILFGSIFAIAKMVEWVTWQFVEFVADPHGNNRIGRLIDWYVAKTH